MIEFGEQHHGPVRCLRFRRSMFGGRFTFLWVYCFQIEGLLIDTALPRGEKEVMQLLDLDPPQQVALTHHHEDHSGNAAMIQERYQVPIYASPGCQQWVENGVPVLFYQRMAFGRPRKLRTDLLPESLETDQYTFEIIPTPGHSSDQISLYVASEGWLFSGDLYLADRTKIFKTGESVKDQIASIQTLLQLDFDTLFCNHNPRFTNGKQHLANKLEHLLSFQMAVQDAAQAGKPYAEIVKATGLKEKWVFRFITQGDACLRNMVQSVLDEM